MKKIILALCTVFTFAIGANAQNEAKKERKQPTKEEMVKHQTDRMAERLDLNDKQKKELLKLNTEYFGKMGRNMTPRKNGEKRERPTDAQMKEMRKKYEEGQKKYNADLKKILTDEQFSKYEKMQQDMKKRRGQRDGRQGKGPRGRR